MTKITDRQRIRAAFRKPTYLNVRVTPTGFEVNGEHDYRELQGRIIKMNLTRKLFDDGVPVCSSPDGIRAENGRICEECLHPRCQPKLRVHVSLQQFVYVLELSRTSAENLFRFEDAAEAQGTRLIDWDVRLRVLDHDSWGEVTFERILPDETSS